MVERGPPRRGPQRLRHRLPHHDGYGCIVGRPAAPPSVHSRKRRSPCQGTAGQTLRQHQALPEPLVLDAEHQHLPRPALGTWTGDLRRRPLSDIEDGTRRRPWPAGLLLRRQAAQQVQEAAGLRQALRRPQRAGVEPPYLQHRGPARARPLGNLPASLQVAGAGGRRGRDYVRLPAHRWSALLFADAL